MSKKHRTKKRPLFDPDEIATLISQAIVSDLAASEQKYGDANDPLAYAKYRQSSEILKKYCSPSQDKDKLEQETFEKFKKVNAHMRAINKKLLLSLPWHLKCIQRNHPESWKIHVRARALIHEVLTPLDEDEWFKECRNSSGSTVGVSYSDTSVEAKLTFPLTVTAGCLLHWQRYRLFNPQLDKAIQIWNAENPTTDPVVVIEGSRASTVDKTTLIRRFICVEPTLNMFLQQGLMYALYARMKRYGLDVETLPDTNKRLAYESSIHGKNATIDWSSASDCVSIMLLKWLLPFKWYSKIYATRCHSVSLNGEWVYPEMVSTMGNAVTFPLETLIFWAYAHATHHTLTEPGSNSLFKEFEKRPGDISVFGDDCVVPSWMAEKYIAVMSEVGFLVNEEKSCLGPMQFRESCGGDYLAGFDVRPFNLKAPQSDRLSSLEPWLYIVMNRMIPRYISYFGTTSYVYDKALWTVLERLFRRYKLELKLVPSFLPDDAGAKLGFDLLRFYRHYRFRLAPIARSHHGTISFQYCRFVYRESGIRAGNIRLSLWLQKPTMSKRKKVGPVDDTYQKRRKGGYVVAKGVTGHWSIPTCHGRLH
jgi:hypothetical protein